VKGGEGCEVARGGVWRGAMAMGDKGKNGLDTNLRSRKPEP